MCDVYVGGGGQEPCNAMLGMHPQSDMNERVQTTARSACMPLPPPPTPSHHSRPCHCSHCCSPITVVHAGVPVSVVGAWAGRWAGRGGAQRAPPSQQVDQGIVGRGLKGRRSTVVGHMRSH